MNYADKELLMIGLFIVFVFLAGMALITRVGV